MSNEKTKPDLLPCPFCGGKPEGSYTIKAVISCTECPASVAVKVHPGIFTTYVAQRDHEQRQAIEAWNRRAALSVQPAAAVVGEPEGGLKFGFDRIREEISADRKQNALTYLSCVSATAAAELDRMRSAFKAIIERSRNDPLGTSKVVDMRRIAEMAIGENHE